jgi:hypothetical protein
MKDFLHHLLFPRESNNHRARVLHNDSLIVTISLFLFLCSVVVFFKTTQPQVLGITANMTVSELLTETNKEREKQQVPPLTLNNQLIKAAETKAHDMFAKDYWAHNAPDGTTPWYFIQNAGYTYLYAGENLARGFSTAPDTMNAWMNSPSHRENILSRQYTEVGFAVATGRLTGDDTVLVVEMFGTPDNGVAVVPPPSEMIHGQSIGIQPRQSLFDSNNVTQGIILSMLFFFIAVLVIDGIIITRKRIVRVVAHNVDHILFFVIVALAVILIGRGGVL